jgi:hypothetical protein
VTIIKEKYKVAVNNTLWCSNPPPPTPTPQQTHKGT